MLLLSLLIHVQEASGQHGRAAKESVACKPEIPFTCRVQKHRGWLFAVGMCSIPVGSLVGTSHVSGMNLPGAETSQQDRVCINHDQDLPLCGVQKLSCISAAIASASLNRMKMVM